MNQQIFILLYVLLIFVHCQQQCEQIDLDNAYKIVNDIYNAAQKQEYSSLSLLGNSFIGEILKLKSQCSNYIIENKEAKQKCKEQNNGIDCVQWGGIMHPPSKPGHVQYGWIYVTPCPTGFKDNGLSCIKPDIYGRQFFKFNFIPNIAQYTLHKNSQKASCIQTNKKECEIVDTNNYAVICDTCFKGVGEKCIPYCPDYFTENKIFNNLCDKSLYEIQGFPLYSTEMANTDSFFSKTTNQQEIGDILEGIRLLVDFRKNAQLSLIYSIQQLMALNKLIYRLMLKSYIKI